MILLGSHSIRAEILDSATLSTYGVKAPSVAASLTGIFDKKNAISNLKIHRSINEPYGTFELTMSPAFYSKDFIDEVLVNSLVKIYIDDKLVSEGIMLRPTVTGQVAANMSNTSSRQIVLRGFELAYLLTDVNKVYGEFTDAFGVAEATAVRKAASTYEGERRISVQAKRTYKLIMDAIKTLNNGQEYTFANGEKISAKFGADGNKVFVFADDDHYLVQAPVSIHLLQPDMSVMDYVKRIADPNFSEVYGDVFNNGDVISLGLDNYKVSTNGAYGIVVRPKVFGRYWIPTGRVSVGSDYYQFSAMKDGTQIYNYFVVGNSVGMSAQFQESTGQSIKDTDSIRQFGYKAFKADVHSVWNADGRKGVSTSMLTELTKEVAEWYKGAENFISGQLSMPYNYDVKLGKILQFTLPKSDTLYDGYIEQLDINADAQGNRLFQVATVTRGRKAYSGRSIL